MAVDAPIIYNGCYVYLRDNMGPNSGSANDMQKHNAEKIYDLLRIFGYSHISACGILGNMQTESGLSPGSLTGMTDELPNDGEHFSDLSNSVMFDWHGSGAHDTGLISWNGTAQDGGNVIASTATRYDLLWYDWELQIFRLELEYIYDPSGWGGVNGTTYNFWYPVSGSAAVTWEQFKAYTGSAGQAADYFREYRERSSGSASGNQHRRENAEYWASYLANRSYTVEVSHTLNACMAYLFRDSHYPYGTGYRKYDCIGFCNLVRRRLGLPQMTNGTNSLWRNVGGNFLWWRGTVQECIDLYGSIPAGAYLFKCYPEGSRGYNPPPEYRGDGVGDFNHIGIFTDRGKGVMQSGGYDDARTGVADCYYHPTQTNPKLDYEWWTHVAFGNNIYFGDRPGPGRKLPSWFIAVINRKRGFYNVIKSY